MDLIVKYNEFKCAYQEFISTNPCPERQIDSTVIKPTLEVPILLPCTSTICLGKLNKKWLEFQEAFESYINTTNIKRKPHSDLDSIFHNVTPIVHPGLLQPRHPDFSVYPNLPFGKKNDY
jgi:hypothetical protein